MSLSVNAKAFVPHVEDKQIKKKPLHSSLSVDVPEFVPNNPKKEDKVYKKSNPSETSEVAISKQTFKNDSKKKEVIDEKLNPEIYKAAVKKQVSKRNSKNLSYNAPEKKHTNKVLGLSKSFNPRHDVNWAQSDGINKIKESYNARHDKNWYNCVPSKAKQNNLLQKSDSVNWEESGSNRHKELLQTYSIGVSLNLNRNSGFKKLPSKEASNQKNDDVKQLSWSSIVKAEPPKRKSPIPFDLGKRSSLTPNTGHSQDFRTQTYDIERDKRNKLNKLKKTNSLLGTLEVAANPSSFKNRSLPKHLNHQNLTESKSLGPYDAGFTQQKPRLDIKRKSLVLKAKKSAGLKQDPDMDNWYQQNVPAKIDLFSSLTQLSSDEEKPPEIAKPTEKRKLTRTTKKVFSPGSNVTNFTEKIISDKHDITDDYFSNDKYQSYATSNDKTLDSTNKQQTFQKSATISYSAMLQKSGPSLNKSVNKVDAAENFTERKPLSSEEIRLMKKAKKKEKKKVKKMKRIEESQQQPPQQQPEEQQPETSNRQPDGKKKVRSKQDITLDISQMVDKLFSNGPKTRLNKSKKQKRVVVSTGVVSVKSGLAKKNKHDGKKTARNKYGGTGVIMDGAVPIVKRGKERENPKKKKPTLLKKIIQAERNRKRMMLERSMKKDDLNSSEAIEVKEQPEINEEKPEDILERESVIKSEHPDGQISLLEESENIRLCAPLTKLPEEYWKHLHSRKFREYCDHVLTKEINDLTYQLLTTLLRFQDRVYHENPTKYKQKRRFVLGLREVLKHTKLKKIKAVIVAPNLERISTEGGLDDYLRSILLLCDQYELPKIFAMTRHGLGKTLKKKAPVSIIGIFNYDGAQDIYKTLINSVEKGKKLYSDKVHDLLLKNNIINKTSATTITTTTPKDERLPGNVYEIKNPASVNDTAYLVKQQMMAKLTGET